MKRVNDIKVLYYSSVTELRFLLRDIARNWSSWHSCSQSIADVRSGFGRKIAEFSTINIESRDHCQGIHRGYYCTVYCGVSVIDDVLPNSFRTHLPSQSTLTSSTIFCRSSFHTVLIIVLIQVKKFIWTSTSFTFWFGNDTPKYGIRCR